MYHKANSETWLNIFFSASLAIPNKHEFPVNFLAKGCPTKAWQDSSFMEWQVNFLSLLGIVERMASYALQINGLDQDGLVMSGVWDVETEKG